MNRYALICDFDHTITTEDMTTLLAEHVGKKEESDTLTQEYFSGRMPGLTSLVQRINFFSGLTTDDLATFVEENNYLRAGAVELFNFCRENNMVTIIASGSMVPFIELYQPFLHADYIIGSRPQMKGNTIVGIAESDYTSTNFKVDDSKVILQREGIGTEYIAAIGDSPADKGLFEFAGVSIAVEPQAGVGKYADHIIEGDLSRAIPYLQALLKE